MGCRLALSDVLSSTVLGISVIIVRFLLLLRDLWLSSPFLRLPGVFRA